VLWLLLVGLWLFLLGLGCFNSYRRGKDEVLVSLLHELLLLPPLLLPHFLCFPKLKQADEAQLHALGCSGIGCPAC